MRRFRVPIWACAAAAGAIVLLAAAAEVALGRKLWGIAGQPGIWSGNIWSEHNSQFLFDPYVFSHVTHGFLLYGLLWLVARNLPLRLRAIVAVAMESAWEVFENTDMIIRRYRAATISLNYFGDSVMNSGCDIVAAVIGFFLASLLPARATVLAAVALEVVLALWIRDSLILNIVMLIHPIAFVRAWQTAK